MMAKISRDEILNACINGIEESFNEYLEWSSNEYLWNAPEYLLTINIAKKLYAIPNKTKFITLEDNVRKTLKNANAKIKGKIENKARADGRSDIIFWWGKGTPRGIIEVKNAVFQKKDIQEDLNRIYAILKKDSDIEFGITTFYIDRHYDSGDASNKIENRIKNEFLEAIEEEADGKNFKILWEYLNIIDEETDAAFAVAIMIYK
jgi:hypothetical protein